MITSETAPVTLPVQDSPTGLWLVIDPSPYYPNNQYTVNRRSLAELLAADGCKVYSMQIVDSVTQGEQRDTVKVKRADADNYCRILAVLGMEEEGDPVAEVQRLLAAPVAAQDAEDAAPATGEQWDALWPAARDVLSERRRQVSAEGWTAEHDDEHENGALSEAAACYAMQAYGTTAQPRQWPWSSKWWKPSEDPRRNLEKAGALILAEMERLDRAAARAQHQEPRP